MRLTSLIPALALAATFVLGARERARTLQNTTLCNTEKGAF